MSTDGDMHLTWLDAASAGSVGVELAEAWLEQSLANARDAQEHGDTVASRHARTVAGQAFAVVLGFKIEERLLDRLVALDESVQSLERTLGERIERLERVCPGVDDA